MSCVRFYDYLTDTVTCIHSLQNWSYLASVNREMFAFFALIHLDSNWNERAVLLSKYYTVHERSRQSCTNYRILNVSRTWSALNPIKFAHNTHGLLLWFACAYKNRNRSIYCFHVLHLYFPINVILCTVLDRYKMQVYQYWIHWTTTK